MTQLFIDTCTSYQPYTVAYYQKMYSLGARSNFVKVSEDTTWVAPKWTESLNNTVSAGLVACVYHFLHASTYNEGVIEANFFAKQLNNANIDKRVKFMVDAESSSNNTNSVLGFVERMKALGYYNACVYSSRSMWVTVLDSNRLPRPWVAGYGVSDLGINNAQAWQYDNHFKGYSQDISKDLTSDHWFTTAPDAQKTTLDVVKPSPVVNVPQGVDGVARDAIRGIYGNGSQRSINIYNHVQNAVNLKASGKWKSQENHNIALIADDVLFNGKYGNGSAREANIYKEVQKRVNELLQ